MADTTKIEWCHHTFNPWWGCVEVSAECDRCYARTFANRIGQRVWGVEAPRRFFGDEHWAKPLKWHAAAVKARERRRVFCASMADVFEFRSDLNESRERLFALINSTPMLDWLLLTKRPEQMTLLTPDSWQRGWPPNVWAGTTTGTRETLELRVPRIRKVPAVIRFISAEPLLEDAFRKPFDLSGIHWGILGGESDPVRSKARPCDEAWIRNGLKAFMSAGVAPFVKQVGSNPEIPQKCGDCDPCLAGERCYQQYNVQLILNDNKGGDPEEWDPALRVREFPEAVSRV